MQRLTTARESKRFHSKRPLRGLLRARLEAAGKFLGRRRPGTLLALSGAVAGVVSLFEAGQAQAVTFTWDAGGTDTNINTAANWNGATADTNPSFVGGDTAVFGTGGSTATINLNVNFTGITINRAAAFTMANGGGSLTIGSGGLTTSGTYTRTIEVSSLVLGASQTWTIGASTTTVTSVITDGGSGYGITKAGAGKLILSGANTYGGATTVQGNGILAVSDSGSISPTTGAALTLGAGATSGTFQYDSSATSRFGTIIVGNGTSNLGTLTQTNGTINASSLTLSNTYSSGKGTVTLGSASGNSAAMNISGDVTVCNASSSAGSVSVLTVNATGALAISGNLLMSASTTREAYGTVTQSGGTISAASLSLSGNINDPTGRTHTSIYNLNGGTLSVGSITAGSILNTASTGTHSLTNTFNLNGGTLKATGNSTSFWASSGYTTTAIKAGGAFIDDGGYAITIGQLLSNASGVTGTLTKLGTGTLTLSGLSGTAASNYSGTTTIGAGTLAITSNANLTGGLTFGGSDLSTITGGLDLTSGSATFAGAMLVRTDSATANTITIGSGQTLSTNGNVTIGSSTNATSTAKLTVQGDSSGNGTWNVSKTGGTFTVASGPGGTNHPTLSATLDMHTLGTFTANLGTTGTFSVGDIGGSAASAASSALLAVDSTITANIVNIGTSAGNGNVQQSLKLGTGTQIIKANTINIGVNTTFNRGAGNLSFQDSANGTVDIHAADGTGAAALNILKYDGTTSYAINNTFDVSGHTANLLFSTVDIHNLSGATVSTFNYNTTFSFDKGTLGITTLKIGTKSGTGTTTPAATVNIGSSNNYTNTASLGAVTMSNLTATSADGGMTNTLNITGAATTASLSSLTVATNTAASGATLATGIVNILGGTTTDAGGIVLTNTTGAGTSNTASGTLSITGGSLTLGSAGITTTGSRGTSTVTLDGGMLDMNGRAIGGAGQLITNLNFKSGTLKNVLQINNGAGLTKSGTGTLILEGTNSYGGATMVSGGTLKVNGSITSGTTVQDTATLGGTGTIGGSVTVNSGGHLAPGNSPGALVINNTLTLNSGSVSDFEIASTSSYDQVTGLTGLSYGGTLNVTGTIASSAHTYTLFSLSSGTPGGTFSTVNLQAAPSGYRWHDYDAVTAGIQGFDYTTGQIQLEAASSAAVKLSAVANALSGSLRSDTTDENDENGSNAVGTIHVTGSNGGFVSEIDGLTNEAGVHDFADGYVQVDNDLSPAPTLVMLWLKDNDGVGTGIEKSDVISSLVANAGGAYTVLTSSDEAWQKLAGAYSGFDTIIDFGSVMGTGDAFSWKFEGDYAAITVDKVAVVPEPGSLGLLGMGALALMGSRRRKQKKMGGETALGRFYGRRRIG